MLYATYEKVLGLVQLPLDGNPNKCMGLIAHPGPIAAISVSYDGKSPRREFFAKKTVSTPKFLLY